MGSHSDKGLGMAKRKHEDTTLSLRAPHAHLLGTAPQLCRRFSLC